MAEVPEDYDSDQDETQEPKRTKSPRSRKLHTFKSDTVVEVTPEMLPEIDREPEKFKTEEDDFEEGKPGNAENVLQESARTPEEEIPKETNMDLPSQTEAEITQVLKLETSWEAGREDLEVPVDEKHEEPDLQPPDVSVDLLFTEAPAETDTQLPTETKTPVAMSSEKILTLPEETGQEVPKQSRSKGDEEIGPEQNRVDFPSEKPRKSVEEEDLPPLKMTKSEITKTQEESAEEKSTEPSEVTKPEFPGQTLRKSTEEVDIKPPEEIRIKSIEQIGTEQQPEQIKPKFPGQKPKQSIEEKVPALLEKLKREFSGEESRKPTDEARLELSERATSEVPKETQSSIEEKIPETLEVAALGLPEEIEPDVQGETQKKSVEEKVPETSEDRKPAGQKEKQRKSSEKSESKGALIESSKKKAPVLQEQMDADLPKKKLQKSTEETGQGPPQMTKPEVQEKSQPAPTKELESSNKPKPGKSATELPKDHRPGPSKLKYPVGKDELVFPEYHKKMAEKETNKAKTESEFMVSSPRESVESGGTDYEPHDELLKVLQTEINEVHPTDPASESCIELRDSITEKNVVVLPQGSENETKINKSVSPPFEHLKWTAENVAEWIGELGFPQYKECFTANFINGPKLIYVNCCNLPQMGITDFEDMKTISRHTRELLGIEEPLFSRSISLPYRDNIGLFLEQKGHSGVNSDSLTLSEFVKAAGLQEYEPELDAVEKHESSLPDSSQEENKAALLQNTSCGKEWAPLGEEQQKKPFHST
ncbi:Sterile alpha motif domain-containing protein 15 [Microtus ochrogaster]|uniref:Sterile alpha motif domain-containing protein 15 n=1 Tax=Microtus ochrogaster TaxID=79684 RepID=A0A8J6KZN6_MICOH|nr:Sterile alpha motif domain-containing protein 15 [Microtus ochrogaster]